MNTNVFRALVSCVLSSLVMSCAATGQNAGANSQNTSAKIYVLRKLTPFRAVGVIGISDNGKPVGDLKQGGILEWQRGPGSAVISATASNEVKVELAVQPNEVYYVEVRAKHEARTHARDAEIRLLSKRDGAHLLSILQHKRDPLRGVDL